MVQNILYGAAGSESQKLREFLRKFTNAWQQQQKQQASNEKDLDMFFKSTRNFVSTISSDISKRFNKSLCRAIDDDSNKKSNEKDFVEDAVCREVESALIKEIGSQLETIAILSTAELDMLNTGMD